jgi:transcriptional regulator with XRE-family HTH domain
MLPEYGARVAQSEPSEVGGKSGVHHDNPLVLQRQLRTAIRDFRHQAKLTQKEVAAALEWSESKIMRIETGVTKLSATDLKALLTHYGITDVDEVNELASLARESRRRTWRDAYRQEVEPQFYLFLGYEESAVRVRQLQSAIVPVTLQTEDYARHLTAAFYDDDRKIRRILDLRNDRQRVLNEGGAGRSIEILLDESVLRRKVGNWATMRDQMIRIKEDGRRQDTSIRVVPFDAGERWGMATSFDIFDLSRTADDRVVFIEHPSKDAMTDVTLRDGHDEMAPYIDGYNDAAKVALSTEETVDMIDACIDRYETLM